MSKTTYIKNEQTPTVTAYDDTQLKARLTALENKQDRDNQTLTINNRTVSISGGNSITLPEDRDTVYNDTDVKRRLTALEGKTDNFVTGVTASRTGNKVKLTYNFVTGQPKTVEFDDNRVQALEGKADRDNQSLSISGNNLSISGGNTVTLPTPTPYNDADIKRRLGVLEAKRDNDNQTLSISNNRLTISNGNSVDIPQPDLSNYVSVNQYNELKDAFTKLLEDLKGSGAWEQTGDTIFKGNLKPNRHLATGNINLFGGQPDGNAFIRTNNGSTENDLTGGI